MVWVVVGDTSRLLLSLKVGEIGDLRRRSFHRVYLCEGGYPCRTALARCWCAFGLERSTRRKVSEERERANLGKYFADMPQSSKHGFSPTSETSKQLLAFTKEVLHS